MLTRYISWLTIGLAAAFLVVGSASFSSLAAIVWLAFAISIGTLAVSVSIAVRYRGHVPTLAGGRRNRLGQRVDDRRKPRLLAVDGAEPRARGIAGDVRSGARRPHRPRGLE
jgi:hypothetical protein